MSVDSFTNCAEPLSADDLLEVEGELGITLPQDFKAHYLTCNGGTPSHTNWAANAYVDFEVESFIPIKYRIDENGVPSGRIEDVYRDLSARKLIPSNFLPFAWDWGGNYFCLDVGNDDVYFYAMDVWDHDLPLEANHRKAAKLLVSGFSKFVAGLSDPEDELDD